LETVESLLQEFLISALSPRARVLLRQLFQMAAHQASECCIPFDRDFANLFDQLLVERKGDVHAPIIRETLNPCKMGFLGDLNVLGVLKGWA
jgi:hypothetical protein